MKNSVMWLVLVLSLFACRGGGAVGDLDYSEYYSAPAEIKLIKAILSGDTSSVNRLAREGVNLNAVGKFENTPVRVAMKVKQKEIAQLLLKLGANPNFVTSKGVAAAVVTVTQKDPEYLKLFFGFGLNPNLKSDDVPLIFYSISGGHWRQYDMLLAKGADINSKTPDGSSLMTELVMQMEYDRAKALLLQGADFRVVSKHGFSVLHSLVDYQRRFCEDPNLPDCRKRAELMKIMQARGMEIPPGLPAM